MIDITDESFEGEVLKSELPVVVYFWAPWAGPCNISKEILYPMAEEYRGICKFCAVYVDREVVTTERCRVMSIPYMIFFRDGDYIDVLEAWIMNLSPQGNLDRIKEKIGSVFGL